MKLTLVISSLSCGGAERVLVLLTQGFIVRGYQVSVVTLSSKDTDFYSLPNGASRIALGVMGVSKNPLHALGNNWYRLYRLRQAIKSTEPEIVISFLTATNILTILSLFKTNYPVIATVHNDPRIRNYGKWWNKLRRLIYPHAAKIVSVSQGVQEYFDWLPSAKKLVIYNPFIAYEDNKNYLTVPQGVDPEKLWITSMGRLTYQKGFDLLLTAFAKIAAHYPNWQLIILGEGQLRQQLENQKESLGLSNQVIFPGRISPPFPFLKSSQFFVMASRFEGFPMAHGEALTCGIPVIATDCPSGPREIIQDGINGILVPTENVSALATAMEKLMSNPTERQHLANHASEILARFGLEKIITVWEALIEDVKLER